MKGEFKILFVTNNDPDIIAIIAGNRIPFPRIQYPANIMKKNIPHTIDAAPLVTVVEAPDIYNEYGTKSSPDVCVILNPLLIILITPAPKFVVFIGYAFGT